MSVSDTSPGARVPLTDPFVPGSPCWIDLTTHDLQASRDFYGGLFGWTFQVGRRSSTGHYLYAVKDRVPVAGFAEATGPAAGPAAWSLYLATHDAQVISRAVPTRGGRLLYGPREVPGQGTMLIAADPTGATIGFWQPERRWGFRTWAVGALCWAELNTRDAAAADHFYRSLFHFQQDQVGDEVELDYSVWSMRGTAQLGRRAMDGWWPEELPAHWMLHFGADPRLGVGGLARRAESLGATVCGTPDDGTPGSSTVLRDPAGALFCVLDPPPEPHANNDDPYDD